jgi:hypothetical protein
MTAKTYTPSLAEAHQILLSYVMNTELFLEQSMSDTARNIWGACSVIEESGDLNNRQIADGFVEWCRQNAPGMLDWDAKGNFVGHVAHENGLTA